MSCDQQYPVVVLGGGAAGIATSASLLKRLPKLPILIVEPNPYHYYQPGWTLVGGGVFQASKTRKKTADILPKGADWAQAKAIAINKDEKTVSLSDGRKLGYEQLVIALGLELRWEAIKGLDHYLGTEGITSNYAYEQAPYTFELIRSLKQGRALFTQPPMPIKCAGAPQKAMYLACSYWERARRSENIQVEFCHANDTLFGVSDYLPALLTYVRRYNIQLNAQHNLVAVDPLKKIAMFEDASEAGNLRQIEKNYDILHLCPPQGPPQIIQDSGLNDHHGWLKIDANTLQHLDDPDIFGLGDVIGTGNAKTAAAVRKQVPILVKNLLNHRANRPLSHNYQGYGSCPLTVEHGKIVLAEFGYNGKLQPSFPTWLLNGQSPTRAAWYLKTQVLPNVYWHLMLKGREWLTRN